MKNNLSDFCNMTDLKRFIFKKDNLKQDFLSSILSGNYQEALQAGLKLIDICPYYMLMSYFIQSKADRKSHEKIEAFIAKTPMASDLAFLLARENQFVDYVKTYLDTNCIKDYIYFLTKKEVMINGHLPFEEALLDNLDDWSIYEYALEKDLNIKKRDTLNYKYYVVHKYSLNNQCVTKEEFEETKNYLFKRVRVFKDLKYLIELCKVDSSEDFTTNKLIDFIKNGFDLETAREIFSHLQENLNDATQSVSLNTKESVESQLNSKDKFTLFKCLLAHLIASKDMNLLVFALRLTYSFRKSFTTNYEISLIHLFLCRFFCLTKEVKSLFIEFDIKNNQLYNLFFVWSDLAIVTGTKDTIMANQYLALQSENIRIMKGTLRHFIEKGKILHSISLVKAHNKVQNEIVSQEIIVNAILSTSSDTIFSDLLGSNCSYLFKKLTVGDKKWTSKGNTITTLFGQEHPKDTLDELFINPLENIKDEKFISWFKANLPKL